MLFQRSTIFSSLKHFKNFIIVNFCLNLSTNKKLETFLFGKKCMGEKCIVWMSFNIHWEYFRTFSFLLPVFPLNKLCSREKKMYLYVYIKNKKWINHLVFTPWTYFFLNHLNFHLKIKKKKKTFYFFFIIENTCQSLSVLSAQKVSVLAS